jgi:hypothetical protein
VHTEQWYLISCFLGHLINLKIIHSYRPKLTNLIKLVTKISKTENRVWDEYDEMENEENRE